MKSSKKVTLMFLVTVLLAVTMVFVGCTKKGEKGNQEKSVKVIDIPLSKEGFVFAAPKTEKGSATIKKVNDWIANNQDKIKALMEKYNTKTQEEIAKSTTIDYATTATDNVDAEFVVITSPDYPPYEYEYDGKYYGVDMEIAQMLAKEFSQSLVVEKSDFDAIIPSTQKEGTKIDLAMAGLSWNEERAKNLNLSKEYVTDSQVIMVNKNNSKFDNAKTADDVKRIMKEILTENKSLKLAAQQGTTAYSQVEALAEDLGKGVQALKFKSPTLALMDMMNGRVDIVIVDKAVAELLQKNIKK